MTMEQVFLLVRNDDYAVLGVFSTLEAAMRAVPTTKPWESWSDEKIDGGHRKIEVMPGDELPAGWSSVSTVWKLDQYDVETWSVDAPVRLA